MRIGDLVRVRSTSVLGDPEDWGFSNHSEMVVNARAKLGVGVVIKGPRRRSVGPPSFKPMLCVDVLWSTKGSTDSVPIETLEVISKGADNETGT
jgi:hypothetical protein